jgi:UDP-N-acetylenolpyruvoylglucosamine reductase
VQHTLAQGFSGLENLSLIPGTVGAAPMQNIGAYGVEIKDVFAGLTALDRQTGELRDFSLEECNFAYRDSCSSSSRDVVDPAGALRLIVSRICTWNTARCASA